MEVQDKIIALLQGELRDDAQLADLMHTLAYSADARRAFLTQVEFTRKIDEIVESIVPSSASTLALMSAVDTYESTRIAKTPSPPRSYRQKFSGSLIPLLFPFFLGAVLGWLLFGTAADEINVNPRSAYNNTNKASKSLPSPIDYQPIDTAIAPHANDFQVGSSVDMLHSSPVPTDNQLQEIDSNDYWDIVVPDGGERIGAGSRFPVVWNIADTVHSVDIDYSIDGGANWNTIAKNISGKKYDWTVPRGIQSNECLVKIRESGSAEIGMAQMFKAFETGGNAIAYSPDSRLLATAASNKVTVWDPETGKKIWESTNHQGPIILVRFNPEGTRMITSSMDGSVIVWHPESGQVERILNGERGRIWPADFSPDGLRIAAGNDDGSITIWDANSGEILSTFKPHKEAVRYLQYSSDGTKIIAASTDWTASVIDAKSGNLMHSIPHYVDDGQGGRRVIVNGIQLSGDNSMAVTCGYDGTVKYWDLASDSLIRTKTYHGDREVSEVQISPDGKLMTSVGYDGSAKIIQLKTGIVLASIQVDSLPIVRAAFTRDMKHVAFMHSSGYVSIWTLPLLPFIISDSFWSIEPCGVDEPKLD